MKKLFISILIICSLGATAQVDSPGYYKNYRGYGWTIKNLDIPNQLRVPRFSTNPSTGNNGLVIYNTTDNKFYFRQNGSWVELGSGGGGATNLDGLSDVTITSVATGHGLWYNGSQFVNRVLATTDIPAPGAEGDVPYRNASGNYSASSNLNFTATSPYKLALNGALNLTGNWSFGEYVAPAIYTSNTYGMIFHAPNGTFSRFVFRDPSGNYLMYNVAGTQHIQFGADVFLNTANKVYTDGGSDDYLMSAVNNQIGLYTSSTARILLDAAGVTLPTYAGTGSRLSVFNADGKFLSQANGTANQLLAMSGTTAQQWIKGIAGGTTGQVLKKNSNTDFDYDWAADGGSGGGSGDVVGPASATDNGVVRFDNTTGKLIQNSNATLSDNGELNLTSASAAAIPFLVKKHASQTGNLAEFRTSADALVTSIDAAGRLVFTTNAGFSGSQEGSVFLDNGLAFRAKNMGGAYDWIVYSAAGNSIFSNESGTDNLGTGGTSKFGIGLAGFSLTAYADIKGSTTGIASLRLRDGVDPTSPNAGDIWHNNDHLYARLNGVTYQLDQQKTGNVLTRAAVEDVAYTATTTDHLIAYIALSTGRTVTLPTAASMTEKILIIKDETGTANTNNITVDGNGSENIDGAATKVISTAYGFIKIYSNGSNWFTL